MNKKTEQQGGLSRTQTVWLAFAASMTLFGGLFVLTGPSSGLDPLIARSAEARGHQELAAPGRAWSNIIVHHSGLHFDDHLQIDRRHRESGLNGSGFHFVIGNGMGSLGDGERVATTRWFSQSPGAHVAITDDAEAERVDQLNLESIGIAIIGDGNNRAPTADQMQALQDLVLELQRDHAISDDRVMLHSDVSGVNSPGRFFPQAEFSQFLATER